METDWLDEEEFNGVAYSYRSWPGHDLKGVVDRFEELKSYIRDKVLGRVVHNPKECAPLAHDD